MQIWRKAQQELNKMESPKYELVGRNCHHCDGEIMAKLVLNVDPATGLPYRVGQSPYILKWYVCNKCKTLFDELKSPEGKQWG